LRSSLRGLRLYLKSRDYRAFVQGVRRGGVIPPNLTEYFGYGLYAGQKAAVAAGDPVKRDAP